ncbi:MAG: hypothetical protein HZA11_03815 [Nitrospirae bacterium]|nr:hypothetical protein [Nitrospirota bacterium]
MKNLRVKSIIFSLALFLFFNLSAASGWHDETHLAVAKAAGYSRWYNAAGPDITKIKADFIERNNHYFDNEKDVLVTAGTVLAQISRYNSPKDSEGHLYGAIIASLREYEKTVKAGKYPEYHVAFCAHYIGDLSQPLHNTPYDTFNKARHIINDGIVENEVLKNISLIEKNIYPVNLRPEHFEEDLAGEIARIANISRTLGHKLRKENRDMTREEAYVQLGHSASLLKAVLKHIGKID